MKKDSNIFTIYDLDKNRYYDTLNLNITKFFSLDDENLALIEKKQSEHDFTLYKYNIRDKSLLPWLISIVIMCIIMMKKSFYM